MSTIDRTRPFTIFGANGARSLIHLRDIPDLSDDRLAQLIDRLDSSAQHYRAQLNAFGSKRTASLLRWLRQYRDAAKAEANFRASRQEAAQ